MAEIAAIAGGSIIGNGNVLASSICTDTRRIAAARSAMFIAIKGMHNNGHRYIPAAYQRGIRLFMIERAYMPALMHTPANDGMSVDAHSQPYPMAVFIVVEDTLAALQALAAFHRRKYACPVIAITGSSGKTIVKEWTAAMLSPQVSMVRSARSFNSQLGVPLSVLQMNEAAQCAVFEAGISTSGEMLRLQKVIAPSAVLITNIGQAHEQGFESMQHKLKEKLILCMDADLLVYCSDHALIKQAVESGSTLKHKHIFAWGSNAMCANDARSRSRLHLLSLQRTGHGSCCYLRLYIGADAAGASHVKQTIEHACCQAIAQGNAHALPSGMPSLSTAVSTAGSGSDAMAGISISLTIPFTDAAQCEDAMHAFALCCALALYYPELNIDITKIGKAPAAMTTQPNLPCACADTAQAAAIDAEGACLAAVNNRDARHHVQAMLVKKRARCLHKSAGIACCWRRLCR
jgi:hypothetical protein